MTATTSKSCELIRVDFRTGAIKCRTSLDPARPKYNPYEDPLFKAYTRALGDMATVMHARGLDPAQTITVGMDDLANEVLVIFGSDLMLCSDAARMLRMAADKLESGSPEEAPGPDDNGAA